ncbi:MAG: phosphoglucosamine mutase, partial [Deltaproteobacteria bacterium]|nr:phosphoglucosamine mutase [Deltaproteobacteria bacterium]
LDHITPGDGILAALQLLEIICKTGRPLSELTKIMESYPQKLINMRVSVRKNLDEINGFKKKLAAVERELGGRGRVLVRFSGTEPLVRVMVEGEREDQIESLAQELALFLEKALK